MWIWPWLFFVACDFTFAEPCPTGSLSDADLPCSCQGAIADSLSCGALTCTDFGLQVEKGSGCTSSTDPTTIDSGTTY